MPAEKVGALASLAHVTIPCQEKDTPSVTQNHTWAPQIDNLVLAVRL